MMGTNEISKRYLAKGANGLVLVEERNVERNMIIGAIEQLDDLREKFILLSVYEGIAGENYCELVNLKYNDVNGNVLKLCTDREIVVSDELINIITALNKETNNDSQAEIVKFAKDSSSEFEKGRWIHNALKRSFDKINI